MCLQVKFAEMEANKKWTALTPPRSRPRLLVGSLLVARNAEEAMTLLVGDQLLGSRLVDVPLRDTHG